MTGLSNQIEEDIGSVPVCATCGSEWVAKRSTVCWNRDSGLWELEDTFENALCWQCEADTTLNWLQKKPVPNHRLRALNDALRIRGHGRGQVLMTAGIQAMGEDSIASIMSELQGFDDFNAENDPWGEHDFGHVMCGEERIFWKIDYFDHTKTKHSPNPANNGATERVLTIMLASEY